MTILRLQDIFWVLVCGLALLVSPVVKAADEANTTPSGVVIEGYDPVAYFTDGKPVLGSSAHIGEYQGATYYFASKKNKKMFQSNPEMYAPAFGGWCSYGVRVGKKFRIDPSAWVIENKRLFLQLDLGTQKIWAQDKAKNIEIADRLWPQIKSVSTQVLGN